MILGRGDDPEGTEWKIDATMWNRIPLPNTVAPSFETCNIARTYELEIRVGLAHGSPGAIKVCTGHIPTVTEILWNISHIMVLDLG